MKVTYVGHATCLIEINGKKILTDPNWAKRIFFIKRRQAPGLKLEEVLPVDLVLLSHAHFDHFNTQTLKKIERNTPVVCSTNVGRLVEKLGFKQVSELNWWESQEFENLKITAVPAKHFGGRWRPRNNYRQYGGFVVEGERESVYFAGDTAYSDEFKKFKEKFNLTAAILPIGAYQGPAKSDFTRVHLNPEQAVQAFQDVGAEYMVPIHYGTFKLSFEPIKEPAIRLKKAAAEKALSDRVKFLKPGESCII